MLSYHHQQQPRLGGTLLDLGCGHGLISRALCPHFNPVVAIDPSAGMVEQAREMTFPTSPSAAAATTVGEDNAAKRHISFSQGSAEDLSFLDDGSVDMAVAGQAAHWFDYSKVWPELARVVRPGGTLAFWGYKDNILLGAERATAVMEQFVYGFGEVARTVGRDGKEVAIEGMGRFWEQPGRNILRDLLRSVVPPERDWGDVTRLEHEPGEHARPDETAAWQRNEMKLGEVERYTRTFSCYNGWKEAFPELKSREDGGSGDVIDVMWDRMLDAMPEWKAQGERWREIQVVSDWGTYVLMARRR